MQNIIQLISFSSEHCMHRVINYYIITSKKRKYWKKKYTLVIDRAWFCREVSAGNIRSS